MSAPLIISSGELAGIAPEIIAESWQHYRKSDKTFAVIGDTETLSQRGKIPTKIIRDCQEAASVFGEALPVFAHPVATKVIAGKPNTENAASVISAITLGVDLCHQKKARGLVTAPIDKSVLKQAGFAFQGHTDFLQSLDEKHRKHPVKAVMMLASSELRCVPVTVHVSLREAIGQLNGTLIRETILCVRDALCNYWGIQKPRIAVSGLNPHAGESGQMGDEENRIITPALQALRQQHPNIIVSDPLPADSLFTPFMRDQYDAFIAMTHDQALIPIKTLYFDQAVNITLGLSFVRTSPDHGTAYDLAGSNRANPSSMIAAIAEAWRMSA